MPLGEAHQQASRWAGEAPEAWLAARWHLPGSSAAVAGACPCCHCASVELVHPRAARFGDRKTRGCRFGLAIRVKQQTKSSRQPSQTRRIRRAFENSASSAGSTIPRGRRRHQTRHHKQGVRRSDREGIVMALASSKRHQGQAHQQPTGPSEIRGTASAEPWAADSAGFQRRRGENQLPEHSTGLAPERCSVTPPGCWLTRHLRCYWPKFSTITGGEVCRH